jgi:hypothetical protein
MNMLKITQNVTGGAVARTMILRKLSSKPAAAAAAAPLTLTIPIELISDTL